jgi:uncharacterized protein (TIGR00725 family)
MERIIGVMGGSACTREEYELALGVGRLVAGRGFVLLCGGGSGVMEAAAAGAKEAGGLTVGVLPGSDASESPANPHIDIALFTGLSDARNAVNVKSAEAVIAIGGGHGTLSEIALALRNGKPVIALRTWTVEREGADLSGLHPAETLEQLATLLDRLGLKR